MQLNQGMSDGIKLKQLGGSMVRHVYGVLEW